MSADEFLEHLAQSRLLEMEVIKAFLAEAPPEASQSGESLANWLLERQALTAFQSRRVLAGMGRALVHPPYELRETLGRGGMGTVYLGWDRDARRYCAVKMLSSEQSSHERGQLRFQREIDVSRRLEHPKLARAYAAGLWRSKPFLAMEYVPGPTLYQLVRRHGPIPLYWTCRWISDVADALDYAHQGGVVHRDLKPSNVIVTPERTAKLLDLGLARWYEDDHNEERVLGRRRIVGSFDYMAPEQADDSSRADARCDIYALGCLLYFLIAGHPPFHHVAERTQKVECHRTVAPTPITVHRPSTPMGLARSIERMLAKSPSDRYSVAAEVRNALSNWMVRLMERGDVRELPDEWFPGQPAPPSHWTVDRLRQTAGEDAAEQAGFWGRLGSGFQRIFGRRADG
jgi:serine/threonine protein kinase